ncbi:MAG: PAS domain-containing hybrid sensor histidine kinase/response regulator [Nitrospirota bacterium]
MKNAVLHPLRKKSIPFKTAAIYALIGGLWILFSDMLVAALSQDPATLSRLQTFKGWFFVAATALMLYVLIRRSVSLFEETERALRESEEKFTALAEHAASAVFICREHFVFVNNAMERLTGYSREELMKMSLYDIASPEFRALAKQCGEGYLRGPLTPARYEFTIRTKSGEDRWIDFTVSSIRYRGATAIVGTAFDITDRKRTEAAVWEANRTLNSLIQAAPLAIIALDTDGKVTLWNPAAERIFGWSAQEATGRLNPIVPEDEKEEYQTLRRNVLQGTILTGIELRRQRKDGSPIDVSLSTAPLYSAEGAIEGTIILLSDITERKRAEEALRESEERYRIIAEAALDAIITIDEESTILLINPAAKQIFGYEIDEMLGKPLTMLMPERMRSLHLAGIRRHITTGRRHMPWGAVELPGLHKDGREIPLEISYGEFVKGGRYFFIGIVRDITEKKKLEQQLIQSQKMEATGQLAGGIAHDFNNIITAIISYGSLMQMSMKEDDPLRPHVEQVLMLADRAAHLTQSLLAFSRKQIMNPREVDLNEIIRKVEKLLLRLISEDIKLRTILTDEPLMIMADSVQIEQALMNLTTNARDAMPQGGTIIISTNRREITEAFTRAHGFGTPGRYALLSFTDTGTGMDEQTRQRAFEPFFTTKEIGRGTGLGLSIVYGIIKQHNGYISLYSEPGKGTTFKIYLPLLRQKHDEQASAMPAALTRGTETVLLAEDETEVRKTTKTVLESLGYTVIEATDGTDALSAFYEHQDRIQLLILDVALPHRNGREVYDEIRATNPDIKVLFTSGYTSDIMHTRGILEEGLPFISKPYAPHELSEKIREVLEYEPAR